jgi:DNA-binding transcriptional LysR family regulator
MTASEPGHEASDHVIGGSSTEITRAVLARHLCGWIQEHHGSVDDLLPDVDMIMDDLRDEGICFVLVRGNRFE